MGTSRTAANLILREHAGMPFSDSFSKLASELRLSVMRCDSSQPERVDPHFQFERRGASLKPKGLGGT